MLCCTFLAAFVAVGTGGDRWADAAVIQAGAPAVRAQTVAEPRATVGEDVVIGKSVTFPSTVLAQRVQLDIALPPAYATSRSRYPVSELKPVVILQNVLAW